MTRGRDSTPRCQLCGEELAVTDKALWSRGSWWHERCSTFPVVPRDADAKQKRRGTIGPCYSCGGQVYRNPGWSYDYRFCSAVCYRRYREGDVLQNVTEIHDSEGPPSAVDLATHILEDEVILADWDSQKRLAEALLEAHEQERAGAASWARTLERAEAVETRLAEAREALEQIATVKISNGARHWEAIEIARVALWKIRGTDDGIDHQERSPLLKDF